MHTKNKQKKQNKRKTTVHKGTCSYDTGQIFFFL